MTVDQQIDLSLLEYLAWKSGCAYLSDLRGSAAPARLYRTLAALPADAFSLGEWTAALTYLTDGRPVSCKSAKSAKELLLFRLGAKRCAAQTPEPVSPR